MKYRYTDEELILAVQKSKSIANDTYRGKNLQSALSEKREVEYRKFREALTDNADGNPEPSSS